MLSRLVPAALVLAFLAVSCGESEPVGPLPTPEDDADPVLSADQLEEVRESLGSGDAPGSRPGGASSRDASRAHPSTAHERAEAGPAGDGSAGETDGRRARGFRGMLRSLTGDQFVAIVLGLGFVGVIMTLLLVRALRGTSLSMDLAVRASRKRYLARCREIAERRAGEKAPEEKKRGAA